ncbi:MAG: DcaP family trimeric outer membrane transporter [Pseudomonadales bacterium]|jgi:hypothetical protein|nr:DcaP family trimeric outer membrane transporter [Pseudomonadales bacterium]
MRIKPIAAALLTLGTLSTASLSMAGETEDRIAELERQLAELKSLVTANSEAASVAQEATVVNAADIEEARPSAKGTKFQYGGFIQLDMAATNYSEGKPGNDLIEDFLVPSLIPVSDGSGSSYSTTNMHAKTSRFFFTTATDTDAGKISTRVELDFLLGASGDERISNSWNPRLRHAFVKWDYAEGKSLLAGQSWSTFFNVGALPNQIDFVGPVGTLFDRQPQIRWTMGGLQLAAENPATRLNVDNNGSLSTSFDDFHEGIPDLVARYNGKMGDLSWSAAGILRELSYDTGTEDDSQMGYGISLAGKWMFGKDDLRFMFNYGDALGRYLGLNSFNDGYVDASGDIQTIDEWGGFVSYQHYWSDHWSSSFTLSMSVADNPGDSDFALVGSLAKEYQSAHASLWYSPAPKYSMGGEYIFATKELEDGRDGDMSRLQFAVKYAF